MNFVERIKQIKKDTGMKTETLAEKSGISVSTLSKLLSGHTEEPKLSAAIAIADALGCSLEYLATGKDIPAPLSEADEARLAKFHALDAHGTRVCDYILNEEYLRVCVSSAQTKPAEVAAPKADAPVFAKVLRIPLFADRVSAGSGMHLDSNDAQTIEVPATEKTKSADFALFVSGNSMEPSYHDGDVLLVDSKRTVSVGDVGIFVCDGEGYFKKFGGDCLISLNPAYAPIPLSSFGDFACKGAVVGSMHRRSK